MRQAQREALGRAAETNKGNRSCLSSVDDMLGTMLSPYTCGHMSSSQALSAAGTAPRPILQLKKLRLRMLM